MRCPTQRHLLLETISTLRGYLLESKAIYKFIHTAIWRGVLPIYPLALTLAPPLIRASRIGWLSSLVAQCRGELQCLSGTSGVKKIYSLYSHNSKHIYFGLCSLVNNTLNSYCVTLLQIYDGKLPKSLCMPCRPMMPNLHVNSPISVAPFSIRTSTTSLAWLPFP